MTLLAVELAESRLEHLRVTDAVLTRCNLANVCAPSASMSRVVIEGSRLTGLELTHAQLSDVTIRDCRVDLASLAFSRLERVSFEDCVLSDTAFIDAQLQSVRFERCDMTRADLRGARLSTCEIRRCVLEELEGVPSLRGASLEFSEIVEHAGVWAAALGIGVLDAD